MKHMIVAFAFVLAATAFATVAHAQQNAGQLSKQQLHTLIASAKTPAEHQRIAAYYSARAQDDLALARVHEQMAARFSGNPVSSSPKFATGTVNHCVSLAENYRKDAARMQAEEQKHEQMAKEAKQN
jgi:hypothetical protein